MHVDDETGARARARGRLLAEHILNEQIETALRDPRVREALSNACHTACATPNVEVKVSFDTDGELVACVGVLTNVLEKVRILKGTAAIQRDPIEVTFELVNGSAIVLKMKER